MSQDSIGAVTTGQGKLQEWKTTQKQNLSRKSRGTLTVKWAGSRDKIFSPSGRGRTFFLTSLFIEPLAQIERHSYSEVGWISRQNLLAFRSRENFFLDIPFYRTSRANREALLQ